MRKQTPNPEERVQKDRRSTLQGKEKIKQIEESV